jgi:glycosyltransferase involved in cell wall biosynthesis
MTSNPLVSLVMSVYNGERFLAESLASIQAQRNVSFELIAVNDGSTDGTGRLLRAAAARDGRIRLIEQENSGLTRALVRGCGAARGRFIARQDNGDLSAPDRLRRLADVLEARPDIAVAASWAEALGPEGEYLMTVRFPEDTATSARGVLEGATNPIHGSVMFRKRDYEVVGGYRPEFYFAQDSDLWIRLAGRGGFLFLPEVLYSYRFFEGSISARNREAQVRLNAIAAECRRARLASRSEAVHLEEAATIRPGRESQGRSVRGTGDYFIGRLLLDNRDPRAVTYLRAHLARRPLDAKGWLALGWSLVLRFAGRGKVGSPASADR